ncbi:MAG: sulfotransferase, partial [Caldilineae bacterium]
VMVGRCRTFFSRPEVMASGRVMLVRYEDLMQDPVREGRRVAEHLGVSPNPRFFRRLRMAHTRSIGSYRRRPAHELAEALAIAGDELAHYGYEV